MSVQGSSRLAFGWSTGNDVSGHYKLHYFVFLFFFLVLYSSHRRSAHIKKLIERKLSGAPKNLVVDPVGHFGAPWRPFQIKIKNQKAYLAKVDWRVQ